MDYKRNTTNVLCGVKKVAFCSGKVEFRKIPIHEIK